MSNKLFLKLFFILSILSAIVLFYLSYIGYSKDKLVIKSQARVEKSKNSSKVVFIGDSSLEHGLDEKYFSKLVNKNVSNLALTAGAHNLSGTFNMIRNVIKNNKNVEYIIIMQNPSIWQSGFSEGGYCSTLDELTNDEVIERNFMEKFGCFKYKYMNVKLIKKAIKGDKEKKNEIQKTYKNGLLDIYKELADNEFINYQKINSLKEKELEMIDDYLKNKNIKVLYVQGTLHYELYLKYSEIINKQHELIKKLKNINFIEEYLYPSNENMGETENHVDISYKLKSTEFYYSILKDYIK